MLWFEYDGPNDEGATDPDIEMASIRENVPAAASCRHDDAGFTVIVWDAKVAAIEAYVFDDGRPTVWYSKAKETTTDVWWWSFPTVGENTGVAARQVHKRVKRREREEESRRLVNDFILCLEEMRGSERGAPEWECALSDARDRLTDLCDLMGVPAEQVIGYNI